MLLAIVLQLSMVFCESLAQETAPNVEFFDTQLLNNSWLGINALSNVSGPSCVTDLAICCPTEQSMASREWVLPNGTRLTQDGVQEIGSLGVSTGAHKFELVLTDSKAKMNGGLDFPKRILCTCVYNNMRSFLSRLGPQTPRWCARDWLAGCEHWGTQV